MILVVQRLGCLLVLLAIGAVAYGQDRTPKFSNEFLAIGAGGRGLGMGNAQVANVRDVTSGYWNPAGLTGVKAKYSIAGMHAEYFAGIAQFDYLAFATPIDSVSAFGVSAVRFGVDDIPDTRFLYDANGAINYDNIRLFNAADYAFFFSYARKLRAIPGLSVGGSLKVIHRVAGSFATSWGVGLDVGAQYQAGAWQLGVTLRDVTTTYNAWSHSSELLADVFAQTGNTIPESNTEITLPRAIIGAARTFDLTNELQLTAALDLDVTFDGQRNTLIDGDPISVDPHAGVEAGYKQTVFVRAGISNIQEVTELGGGTSTQASPSFGVGLRLQNVQIDYALTDIGDQSESLLSHIFSVQIDLNGKN